MPLDDLSQVASLDGDLLPDPLPEVERVPDAALAALLKGTRIEAASTPAESLRTGLPLLWRGRTPSDKRDELYRPGLFWAPCLFSAENIKTKAIPAVMRRKNCDARTALASMTRFHSGLGKDVVSGCPWAQVEVDHTPFDVQEQLYDELRDRGVDMVLRVHSGGKSIHGFVGYRDPLDPADPRRSVVQRLLIVCVQGDTRITDPSRLMRAPAYYGSDRQQRVMLLQPDALQDVNHVVCVLTTWAADLGIHGAGGVDKAFRALSLAEQLGAEAKGLTSWGSRKIAIAEELRATRADPDPQLMEEGKHLLSRRAQAVAAARGSGSAAGGGGRVYLTRAAAAALIPLEKGSTFPAPCCAGKSPRGYVLEQGRKWFCNRDQVTYVLDSAKLDGAAPELGDLDWGFAATVKRGTTPAPILGEEVGELPAPLTEAEKLAMEEAEWTRNAAIPRPPDRGHQPDPEDEKEAQRKQAQLAVFAARLAEKKAEAEEVDPRLVATAKAAMKLARELHPMVRDRMRAAGLPLPDPAKSCGFALAVQNAVTGKAGSLSGTCGTLSCPTCGPKVVAQKIAAILTMPIFVDCQPLGAPLGGRPLWAYEISPAMAAQWDTRWGAPPPS